MNTAELPSLFSVFLAVAMTFTTTVAVSAAEPSSATKIGNVKLSAETGLTSENDAKKLNTLVTETSAETEFSAAPDPQEEVTIIVELEGAPVLDYDGMNAKQARSTMAASIEKELLEQQKKVQDKIAALLNSKMIDTYSANETDILEVTYQYTKVMNGFSVKVPYALLKEIKELDGVKNAFVEQTYTIPDPEFGTKMSTSSDMIGGGAFNTTGYKGEGMLIAVIDSGFDTSHDVFQTAPPEQKYTDKSSVPSAGLNGAEFTYVNEKIPFAFDYNTKDGGADGDVNCTIDNDHGTHVAGTVAGNSDVIQGIAPNAQLALMKVFNDAGTDSAAETEIIAALEDCITIGADVVNLSLGDDAGFSTDSSGNTSEKVYQRVYDSGVTLSIAAGNATDFAMHNLSGNNLPRTSDPDSGVVCDPSSYLAPLSVAAVENTGLISNCFTVNNHNIAYRDAAETEAKAFYKLSEDAPLEYVMVPVLVLQRILHKWM